VRPGRSSYFPAKTVDAAPSFRSLFITLTTTPKHRNMATIVLNPIARPKRTVAEMAQATMAKHVADLSDDDCDDSFSVEVVEKPAKKPATTPVVKALGPGSIQGTPGGIQTPSGTPFASGAAAAARPVQPSTPSVPRQSAAEPEAAAKKKRAPTVPKGAPAPLDKLLAPLDSTTLSTLLQQASRYSSVMVSDLATQVCARSLADQAAQPNEQFLRQQLGGSSSLSKAAVTNRLEEAQAAFKKISKAFPHTRWGRWGPTLTSPQCSPLPAVHMTATLTIAFGRLRYDTTSLQEYMWLPELTPLPTQAEAIRILLEPLLELKEAKNDSALLAYLLGMLGWSGCSVRLFWSFAQALSPWRSLFPLGTTPPTTSLATLASSGCRQP
jgi:hypothetical protein